MTWLSHSDPEQTWESHVSGVVRMNLLFQEGIDSPLLQSELLRPLSVLTAGFHDLAKTTTYFQSYIQADAAMKVKMKGEPLYRHAFLSAICCYYVVDGMYERHGMKDHLDPLIAYVIVRRHHGSLKSIVMECEEWADDPALMQQAEALPWADVKSSLLRILDKKTLDRSGLAGIPLSVGLMKDWIAQFPKKLGRFRRQLYKNKHGGLEFYLKTQMLFSLLIDADKSQVGIGDECVFQNRPELDHRVVSTYVESLTSGTTLDHLRRRAWAELDSVELPDSHKIFMINLPTGMGKTLNSFHIAMRLREKAIMGSNGKIRPRIIYALPFLSVIDQNASVYSNVLFGDKQSGNSSLLLKHHHLSDMKYEVFQFTGDEMAYDRNAAQLLIEGWNSEIVVTTFVQLFHTLISNKNQSIRKFHRLSHSVILIDEFQSMPVKYWPALRELFLALTEWLDCRIVFLTATDPKIFREHEICQLCNRNFYFHSMDRLVLYSHIDSPKTVEHFAESVLIEPGKRYLFIVNTVPCAVKLYRLLEENYGELRMTFLSTHVLPCERLERIGRIQKNEFDIVISTQLVEAGVDIDFDVVYRDWAPLDAIYQSAGRCNRHGDRSGEVHVVRLIKDNGHAFAPTVYGGKRGETDNRLEITRQLLSQHPVMNEREFLNVIEIYFKMVKEGRAFRTSEQLVRAMSELIYTGEDPLEWRNSEYFPLEYFKLIEEDQPKTDVFFVRDEQAEELWNQYERIQQIPKPFERYAEFSQIKYKFYQYVIALPVTMKNIPPMVEGMYVVPNLQMSDFYDEKTGYRNEDVTVIY